MLSEREKQVLQSVRNAAVFWPLPRHSSQLSGHTGANEFFGSEVISGTCAQLSPDGLRIGEHTGTDLRIKTGGESGSC